MVGSVWDQVHSGHARHSLGGHGVGGAIDDDGAVGAHFTRGIVTCQASIPIASHVILDSIQLDSVLST